MIVFVTSNLSSARETFGAEVEISTDCTADTQTVQLILNRIKNLIINYVWSISEIPS